MDRLELGPVVAMRSPNIKYVRIDASGFMTAAQLASALGDPRLGQFVSQTGWSAAVLNASGMDRFGTDDVEWMSEQWAPMLASVNVRKLSVVVAERVHMLFKSVFAGLAPRAMKAGVELRYFPSAQFTSTFESVTWFETPAAPRSGPGPPFEAPLIIDRPAWVAANCGGIAFLTPANGPPGLGFIFQDAAAAIHIFEGWRRRFGERDEAEMLRVAIIEGDILGKQSGYTLTIGPNLEAIVARAVPSGGLSVDITKLGGWLRRMDTPPTGSPHLQTFKQMYAARREYALTPVVLANGGLEPLYQHQIIKRQLHLRHASQIVQRGDPDVGIFS